MTVETQSSLPSLETELVIECPYDPPHEHVFPGDWQFGGPNGTHPGADPRWRPTTYFYVSDKLEILHTTSAPLCDDEAIDKFTWVRDFGPGHRPKWLQVKRPDETTSTLPVIYNPDTDEVFDT